MSRPKKTTMQSIADDLKLNRRTVSAVLNNSMDKRPVNAKTAETIRKYVKKIGYHQNISALSMRGKYSKEIGILSINTFRYPAQLALLGILESYFSRQEILPFILAVDRSSPEIISEIVQQLKVCNVRKIIILGSTFNYPGSYEGLNSFLQNLRLNLPESKFYVYGCNVNEVVENNDFVCSAYYSRDERLKIVNETAIANGYERIILLPAPDCAERYFPGLEIIDLELPDELTDDEALYLFRDERSVRQGVAWAGLLKDFKFRERRTMIHVNDDLQCMAFARRMIDTGYHIPDDFGLISWDNVPASACMNISSIGFDFDEIVGDIIDWVNSVNPEIRARKLKLVMNDVRSF